MVAGSHRVVPVRDLQGVVLRQRVGRADGAAARAVQAGVDDDPVQPGGHRRVAAPRRPATTGTEGGEQRVLQGVRGLLGVAEGAQRDRPQPVAVPADQLAERVGVAVGVRAQQVRASLRPSSVSSATIPP